MPPCPAETPPQPLDVLALSPLRRPCAFSSARPSDTHSSASRGLMAADTPVDPLAATPHGAAQPPNAAADAGHVPRLDLGSVRSQAAPSGALATARASGRSAALRRLLRRHVVLNAHANRQRRPQTLQIVDTAVSAVARVRLATAEATVCTWPMPICQGVPQVDVSCLLPFDRVGPCVPAECATHQLSSTYQFAGRVLRSLPKRYPNLVLLKKANGAPQRPPVVWYRQRALKERTYLF